MKTEKEILENINERLQAMSGETKLLKLHSYYFTWSVPKYPESGELFDLILKLAKIKNTAEKQMAKKLWSDEDSGPIFTLDELDGIFDFVAETDYDQGVVDQMKMHYFMLREIRLPLSLYGL